MSKRGRRRTVAGIAAVVTLAASLAGLAYLAYCVAVTEPPNPYEPNGDPCCGHPDTWHDVWVGMAFTLGVAIVVGGLLAVSVVCFARSVRDRGPCARRLLAVPLALVLLTGAGIAETMHEERDAATVPDSCHRSDLEHCAVPRPAD